MTEKERFDQYVYPDPNSGCFLWVGATDRKGYGAFAAGSRSDGTRRRVTAHRYAWLLSGRALPPDLCLCHKCDTPSCVNPDHLFLGTRADNNRDMAQKDRYMKGRYPRGVFRRRNGRFAVAIYQGPGAHPKMKYLGTFDDVETAAAVATVARKST